MLREHEDIALDRGPYCRDKFEEMDANQNWPSSTDADSDWAVRVLNHLCEPNKMIKTRWVVPADSAWEYGEYAGKTLWVPGMSNVELWVAFMKSMQFTDGPHPLGRWDDGELRTTTPLLEMYKKFERCPPGNTTSEFATAYFAVTEVDMKMALDEYYRTRIDDPNASVTTPSGVIMSFEKRYELDRRVMQFTDRGRFEINDEEMEGAFYANTEAYTNRDAGIGEELKNKDFFTKNVQKSGKLLFGRDLGPQSRRMQRAGLPSVAGASGTVDVRIITMEENVGAKRRPRVPIEFREVLITIESALLVAGGMHSLAECLAVAQAMGYFNDGPFYKLPALPFRHAHGVVRRGAQWAPDGPAIQRQFEAALPQIGVRMGEEPFPLARYYTESQSIVRKPSGEFGLTVGTVGPDGPTEHHMVRRDGSGTRLLDLPDAEALCEEEAGSRHNVPCACNLKAAHIEDCIEYPDRDCCCTKELVELARMMADGDGLPDRVSRKAVRRPLAPLNSPVSVVLRSHDELAHGRGASMARPK